MGIHEIFRVIDCLIKGESAYLFGQLLSEFELNNNVYCQRFNSTTAMFLFSTVKCDHHLTTTYAKAREASSEKASRAFNISFLICAQPTKNGLKSRFGVVCLGTPTRKAAGSNPDGRPTKRPLCENTAAFSWYFKFSANGKPSGILCADQISALAASRQRSNFPGIPLPAIHPVFTP